MARSRKKPLAQLEHGTRIYEPSSAKARYRVVANDPLTGDRIFFTYRTEEQARAKAREVEQFIALQASLREPDRTARTVDRLADRYVDEHLATLSLRFREKQTWLLKRWV